MLSPQIIFLSNVYSIAVFHKTNITYICHFLTFGQFSVMIDAEERTGYFYDNFAGTENNLNHVLSTFVDSEHEI